MGKRSENSESEIYRKNLNLKAGGCQRYCWRSSCLLRVDQGYYKGDFIPSVAGMSRLEAP